MTNAREVLAAKNGILLALEPTDIPRINFRPIADAIADAIARGWTGTEVARHATQGAYTGEVDNLGALLLTNIRDLATQDPPRTPSPPAYDRAEVARTTNAAAKDPSRWAAKVREAK